MKERFIINLLNKKVEIDYPCRWLYKVIGPDESELKHAIAEIVAGFEHSISLSNRSKKGKYLCYNVKVLVTDEDSRNRLFHNLKAHRAITMVL